MKKVSVLALSLTSLFALTGCGMFNSIMSELNKEPDKLPKTREQTRQAVKDFATKSNGVEFYFTFRDGDTQGSGVAGIKNGSYWEVTDYGTYKSGYVAIKEENGNYQRYLATSEAENPFVYDKEITGYEIDDVERDFLNNSNGTPWLLYAHTTQLTKKGGATVLDRPCTEYEFTYSGISNQLGEELEYSILVDNELCITMKIAIYGSSSSDKMNLDVRSIKKGSDVNIPEVPEVPSGDEDSSLGE